MRIKLCLLLTLSVFVSCQNIVQKEMVFNPKNRNKYSLELKTENLDIKQQVTCDYKKTRSQVEMKLTLNSIQYKNNSDKDNEINAEYQTYINSFFNTIFDKYGNSIDKVNIKPRIVNSELLVVQFPKHKVKKGDIWTGTKSANPDFIFKEIEVIYKCLSINNKECLIEVDMKLKKQNGSDYTNSMTKNYKGTYTIENDGTVKSAFLQMSGYSGLSNISGFLKIQKIK